MDIEKLIEQYRQAADKWEKRHPVTDTFDLRVQDALRDASTALSTLQAENEKLRAELDRVKVERDAYQVYFKDLSSKPDCNTCEKRNCNYRPKLGATVRVNCPLYSGPQKED